MTQFNHFSNIIFSFINKLQQNLFRLRQKNYYKLQNVNINIDLFTRKEVLHGPFKGMVYADLYSAGSTLYPKLLGSYESELHPFISELGKSIYKQVIDVGCAEGYYAIGFLLIFETITMHAFDINNEAIMHCKEMAKKNNVSSRLFTYLQCDDKILTQFNFSNKTLILVDCEGFEKKLFNSDNIKYFNSVDIIIEIHDFKDDSISSHLLLLFEKTHNVEIISSISDFEKPFVIKYSELQNLDYSSKYNLLAEKRPCIMQWFFLKSMT